MKFRLLAVTSIAVVTLAGCGGNGFDSGKAADTIRGDLGKVSDQGVPVDVTCPENVEYVKDGNFTCEGTVNGKPLTFTVSMGATAETFSYQLSAAVLSLDRAKAPVIKTFEKYGATKLTVNCGSNDRKVLVVPVGTIFECGVDGTYLGGHLVDAVRMTVTDTIGNVDWKPFSPPKNFVPREIVPIPKPTPSRSGTGTEAPQPINSPPDVFVTPQLVLPTPSTSKK